MNQNDQLDANLRMIDRTHWIAHQAVRFLFDLQETYLGLHDRGECNCKPGASKAECAKGFFHAAIGAMNSAAASCMGAAHGQEKKSLLTSLDRGKAMAEGAMRALHERFQ